MSGLSACINSHNAEDYIRQCLESVTWADEIVVQDCSSTDRTVDIAREFTDKIFLVPNNPDLPNPNYNRLFERASQPWILFLNEDERVSPELREEIAILLAGEPRCSGYWLPRRNLMLGRWIENGLFAPEASPQLRLFRNGQGHFACEHVHEVLLVDGPTDQLKGHLLHEHTRESHDFLRRIAWYSTSEGEMYLKMVNGPLDWSDFIWVPTQCFASSFFVRKGYRDGVAGLAVGLLYALENLAAVLRAWDLTNQWARSQNLESDSTRFRNDVMRALVMSNFFLLRKFIGVTAIGERTRRLRDVLLAGVKDIVRRGRWIRS